MKNLILFFFLLMTSISFTHAQWTTSGSDIYFNSGSVGVGISSPGTVFHVSGDNTSINTNLITSDKLILTQQAGSIGFAGIVASGSSVYHRAVFKGVRSGGTLGSPSVPSTGDYVFSLLGSIYDGIDTHATAGIEFQVDGSVSNNNCPQRIGFFTDTGSGRSERMTIKSDGQIGIGTNSPLSKLHIKDGNIFVENTTEYSRILLKHSNIQKYSQIIYDENGITKAAVQFVGSMFVTPDRRNNLELFVNGNGDAITMLTNATERMRITQNGNVGIGITNPSEKLVVDGKILAEEVKVQAVPSSDYVFEPGYDLKSIDEVEKYIIENKHLPDIPSAKEFEEDGIGLGEMDNMLLQKIEELTLYIIKQQKNIDELQEENRKQDLIINALIKSNN